VTFVQTITKGRKVVSRSQTAVSFVWGQKAVWKRETSNKGPVRGTGVNVQRR